MIEQIQCDLVQAEVVTEVGHIAPVRFRLDVSGTTVAQPYSLPTWTPEECTVDIPAIRWLRGEFFGFPFGVTGGVEHVHGAAANGPWDLTAKRDDRLTLSIDLGDLGGTLEKQVSLRPGHRVLYNQHTITGVEGRFNYGHHQSSIFPKANMRFSTSGPLKGVRKFRSPLKMAVVLKHLSIGNGCWSTMHDE